MMNFRKTLVFGSLLLFGAAACADLEVVNENAPDRRRALATPGDVESLIAGSYSQWFVADHKLGSSPNMFLSTQAFHHSATAANFGILTYSRIPRSPIQNTITDQDYDYITGNWTTNYRALAAVADGMRALASDPEIAAGLGANNTLRARIFGKFVQGLAHGSIALLYDRGYVIDENVTTIDEQGNPVMLGEPVGYNQVMAAALAKLDQAIALAATAPAAVTIPADWMGATAAVDMPTLIRLMYSMKARLRANVARTPEEGAAVNWAAVLSDVGNGLRSNFMISTEYTDDVWAGDLVLWYGSLSTWQQVTLFIYGMADQSGNYQRWLAQPVLQRDAFFNGSTPVVIVTPDLRFPRGTTAAEQALPANRGRYIRIRSTASGAINNAVQFSRPDRGTWRWSQYYNNQADDVQVYNPFPLVDYDEMRLLAAEAHFRLGQLQQAADSVNVTRVFNGLNATNAAGLNTSCVPKLPNGTCGDLFEMLIWEKRMETFFRGPLWVGWFFDSRRWRALYRGTPLQLPIPAEQYSILGLGAPYTFGGVGGQSAAPQSRYQWPFE